MLILSEFGCNEQGYIGQAKHLACQRPGVCPLCGAKDSLIGHGYYERKVLDEQQAYFILVKRWRCQACHGTFSILPNFLVPHRQYLVRVIQGAVVACFEQGLNWKQVGQACARGGSPVLRTLQRWCKAFGGYASLWLAGVQTFLAQQQSASSWLDPQGEGAQTGNGGKALLSASLHLLAWAKTEWVELVGYGLADRLRFLGLWGCQRGLGRLV
jgi:transposase-like protein